MSIQIAVASRSFSQDVFLREQLLSKYSNVKFNESGKSFQGDELVEFLKDADKAIIALEKVNESILQKLPKLKLISKYGVGLDNIYFEDLAKCQVQLAWKGGVNKRSVAELALHFILGTVRGSFHSHHDIQSGNWYQFKGFNLTGKTVGIIGLGHVGQELVPMLKPFNVKLLAYDIHDRRDFCRQHEINQTGLKDLLAESDIVTIHVPHTSKTRLMLNKETMALMKNGSFLVNTARGGIVDEEALEFYLSNKKLASAAFDVFKEEPFVNESLKKLHNFYFTSHIGGSSIESIHAMGLAAIEGLDQGKAADPKNFFDYEL